MSFELVVPPQPLILAVAATSEAYGLDLTPSQGQATRREIVRSWTTEIDVRSRAGFVGDAAH